MVKTAKLRGIIAERGRTQKDVAHHIGVSPATFGRKLRVGIFNTDEVDKMVDYLEIENPADIFFAR